jgi:hypothetical protein
MSMNSQRRLTIATATLLATCTATAQTAYKSVDAQRRVKQAKEATRGTGSSRR